MTTKKDKDEKATKIAKKAKKAIVKVEKPKAVPVLQNKETLFSATQIAEMLGIPSFEFFIIKSKYNIDDEALFTISQFKEIYKQTIEGR